MVAEVGQGSDGRTLAGVLEGRREVLVAEVWACVRVERMARSQAPQKVKRVSGYRVYTRTSAGWGLEKALDSDVGTLEQKSERRLNSDGIAEAIERDG